MIYKSRPMPSPIPDRGHLSPAMAPHAPRSPIQSHKEKHPPPRPQASQTPPPRRHTPHTFLRKTAHNCTRVIHSYSEGASAWHCRAVGAALLLTVPCAWATLPQNASGTSIWNIRKGEVREPKGVESSHEHPKRERDEGPNLLGSQPSLTSTKLLSFSAKPV